MPPMRSVAPGTPVRAGAPVLRSSRTQLTCSRRETEALGNTSSSAARPSLLRNVRRVSRERPLRADAVALGDGRNRNHAVATRVAREALGETIDRIPSRVGLRDGIRWQFDNHAQRLNNAGAIHLFQGVQRVHRFRRRRKPIPSRKTGIEPRGLPGEQQQRGACQKDGKPGMGDNHLPPLPPAIAVRAARCASSFGVKGSRPASMRGRATPAPPERGYLPATRKFPPPGIPRHRWNGSSLMGTVRRARNPMATVEAEIKSVYRPA
jgi:hypothetical protein